MKKTMNKGLFFTAMLATAMVFTNCSSDKDVSDVLAKETAVSSTETGPLTGPSKVVGATTKFTAWTQDVKDGATVCGTIKIWNSAWAECTLIGTVDVPRAELSDDGYWQQAGASTVTVKGTFKCTIPAGQTTGCGSIFQVINHVDNGSGGYTNQANIILYAYNNTNFLLTGTGYRQYLKVPKLYGEKFDITVTIINDKNCRTGGIGTLRVKIGAQSFPDFQTITQGSKGAAIKVGAYSTRSGNKDQWSFLTGTTSIENLTVSRTTN